MTSLKNKPRLTKTQLEAVQKSERAFIDSLRGVNGIDGKDGLKGESGEDGKTGTRGMQGESGCDGARGKIGPQGPKGEKGDSIKGDPGDAGNDGRGITHIRIANGNLIITYTDGAREDLGMIQGPRGPQGLRGYSGAVFGNSTSNVTNVTEEVLSPTDSANLAAISPAIEEQTRETHEQLLRVERELKFIKTHLNLVTDEKITDQDIEKDEQ